MPWLGTTWHERGVAYWLRRVLLSLFLLAILVLYAGFVVGVRAGIGDPTGQAVFVAIMALGGVGSAIWYVRRQRLGRRNLREALARGRREGRRLTTALRLAQAAALVLGLVIVAGLVIHGSVAAAAARTAEDILVLLVGLVFLGLIAISGGAFLVVFVQSLAPQLETERQARDRLPAAEAAVRRPPS